jgi:hypothetical protein
MTLIDFVSGNVSEKLYKWRYKLQHLGDSGEKTLSDFSSADSGDSNKKKNGPRKTKSTPASASPGAGGRSKNGELGASVSVKTLYEGPKSQARQGLYEWVDYPPKQLSKSAAKAQDRVAIKVFKVKDLEKPVISGRFSLRYHLIEVQNPLLVAAVAEILKKQDIHLDVCENATFRYPFPELYFGYDGIVVKHRSLDERDPEHPVRPFLLLLIRLLDDIFADTRAKLRGLRADNLMSFKLAWTLFPKNTAVVSWSSNCELLFRVNETAYHCSNGKKTLIVKGKVLRFGGRGFLWEDYDMRINNFTGNRPITELAAYPLEFHDTATDVRERLAARGKKVLDYQGLAYVNYSGIAIHNIEDEDASKHNVDGRVLIDVIGYNKHHLAQGSREGNDPQSKKKQLMIDDDDNGRVPIDVARYHHRRHLAQASREPSVPQPKERQLVVGDDDDDDVNSGSTGTVAGEGGTGTTSANASSGSIIKRLSPAARERNKQAMLARETEEPLLMFMLPLIEGYALKNKLWMSFFVEDIKPVVWNDEAYHHLVYNEQQKDLVMSFVESHCSNSAASQKRAKVMEDVIAGKGEH